MFESIQHQRLDVCILGILRFGVGGAPLYMDQMSLIDSSLTTIKQLMYFSKENAQCQTIGSVNANPDHLEKYIGCKTQHL